MSYPRTKQPRALTLARAVGLCLVASVASGACNSSRPIIAEGTHTTIRDTTRPQIDTILPPRTITPNPLDDEQERLNNPNVLAERLGRLDAMMRRAPADSAAQLRREYDSLLAEFTGETRNVATGNADLYNPARDALNTERGLADVDSFLATRDNSRARESSSVPQVRRMESRDSTRPRSVQRSTTLRATQRSAGRRAALDKLRRSGRITRTPGRDVAASRTSPANSNRRDGEKDYIEGLASASAGRYEEAAVQLPRAIESGELSARHRTQARRSYGESLEATGDSNGATAQYRGAARQRGDVGDRAFIDACRALAKSGDRSRARTLLRDFIRKNPRSKQVVNARRLLQTI